jgi:hypothetical protein
MTGNTEIRQGCIDYFGLPDHMIGMRSHLFVEPYSLKSKVAINVPPSKDGYTLRALLWRAWF